jgi:DedD protein
MRDAERLREKLELSLDRRQVTALLACALLLLSGVFALGLIIGKRVAGAQPAAAVSGDLAALDAQATRKPGPVHEAPAAPAEKAPAEDSVRAEKPAAAQAMAVPPPAVHTAMVVPQPPQRPTQVVPAGTVSLTPPPPAPGAYTVQVGASQDRTEAARLEGRLRGAGLKPYVMEANLGAKGTWYRIRVGSFRDKDSANRFRKDVERELRTAAVVMPTR